MHNLVAQGSTSMVPEKNMYSHKRSYDTITALCYKKIKLKHSLRDLSKNLLEI